MDDRLMIHPSSRAVIPEETEDEQALFALTDRIADEEGIPHEHAFRIAVNLIAARPSKAPLVLTEFTYEFAA